MATNYTRPIITQGNDFYITLTITEIVGGSTVDFDLTKCTSVECYLICASHNRKIDLDFELLDTENHNVIKAFVDHRMLHNTSYGICVEGDDENNMHWRWYAQPKEGILIIPNTSGQTIPVSIEYVDLACRVGFGTIMDDFYTKDATDDLLATKQDTLVSGENIKTINNESLIGQGNINIDTTQVQANWGETDDTSYAYILNKPDLTQYTTYAYVASQYATASQMASKQDTLLSGVNIKTINNESLLGSGNITIEAGTSQVQANWNETNSSSYAYIQNKPDLSLYTLSSTLATVATSGNYNDLINTPVIPAAQVQADWNETNSTYMSYIQNKPVIQQDGFISYTNPTDSTKIGLVNSLSSYFNTNIGKGAVIEGDGVNWGTSITYIEASGLYSHAEGERTTASGNLSHAEGKVTSATSEAAHSEGDSTQARGSCSHAEGYWTRATDYSSHAEGTSTTASGNASHAEGNRTTASGENSHAEGRWTTATNYAEHASGYYNSSYYVSATAFDATSGTATLFSVGNGTADDARHNALEIKQNGDIYISYNGSDVLLQSYIGQGGGGGGTQVQADWNETNSSYMSYIQNKPDLSNYATNTDLSYYALSSSLATVATSGNYNDLTNTPTIPAAQVQADWSETSSSAMAYILNKPTIPAAQVQADWSESDSTSLAYIQNKPNISSPGFVQLVNGNKVGLVNSLSTGYDTNIGNLAVIEGAGGTGTILEPYIKASGFASHAEGWCTEARGNCSHAEGTNTHASGINSHAEGKNNVASGEASHAEGAANDASAKYAHVEGYQSTASGFASHAEGNNVTSSGTASHAEGGQSTSASGNYSHGEGAHNTASGYSSHAEGTWCTASGFASHAEGRWTTATNYAEHACGNLNNSSYISSDTFDATSGTATLFSVGNGTADDARHNALEIKQNGDIYLNDGSHPISSTTNGLKIEVVSALPATPDANTLYIII